MIYFMHIGFDGGRYRGWQWQPKVKSVQGTLENTFQKIFGKTITVYGCGRTDAGVHAMQYIMHVDLEQKSFDFDLKYRLNKNLPNDIAIYDIIPMPAGSHSRYDARSRTYDYFIHLYPDAFLMPYSAYYEPDNPLDIPAMVKAVSLLTQYKDFKHMCKQPQVHNHTLCNISEAILYTSADEQRLRLTLTANRFLRGMVRIITYYIMEVGRGVFSVSEFESILAGHHESLNVKLAYPNGLFLSKVIYPYLDMPPTSSAYRWLTSGLDVSHPQ